VLDVAIHPQGQLLATASSDGRAKLWDLGTRTEVQALTDHKDQVGAPGRGRRRRTLGHGWACLAGSCAAAAHSGAQRAGRVVFR
jgi:WD40 repeat protein